jgi:hypothetical protein
MKVIGQLHAPAILLPGKSPGNRLFGGWVGPRGGFDVLEETNISDVIQLLSLKSLHVLDRPSNCQLVLVRPLGLSSLPSGSSTVHYLSIILIIRPCAAFDADSFIK